MGRFSRLFAVLLAVTAVFPAISQAQDDNSKYAFVIFETNVTRDGVEISDQNPQEQRVYISNVVAFPEEDQSVFRNASKIADDYFTSTVVEPYKAKGIAHQYYDDAIKINDRVTYNLANRAEVEELRTKVLEEWKERTSNVFTFTWTRMGKLEGLKTSKPTLFFRYEEEPLYLPEEPKPDGPTPPVVPVPPTPPAPPVAPPPVVAQPTPVVPKTPAKVQTPKPKVAPKTPVKAKPKPTPLHSKTKPVIKKKTPKKPTTAHSH